MNNKKLYPNCSEYVVRIKMKPEELVKAKELAKAYNFNEEDLKNFYEELENGTDEEENSFGSFICTEYAEPYEKIKEAILLEREKYNIIKRRWWEKYDDAK